MITHVRSVCNTWDVSAIQIWTVRDFGEVRHGLDERRLLRPAIHQVWERHLHRPRRSVVRLNGIRAFRLLL